MAENKTEETGEYTFFNNMGDARKQCDPWIPMQYILDRNGISERLTGEEAKALYIHLTISALGVGDDSDILLCSMGLLKGYDKFLSLGDRREHYQQMVSFFKKEQKQTDKDRDPKARTKNLIQKENKLIEKIEKHYLQGAPDPEYLRALLKEAKKKYLKESSVLGVAAQVELPEPSYLANRPICNIGPDESLFIGREKILETIEKCFKDGKKIQILHGMGGVGKTRIARQYAYSHQYDYAAIAWIDATSPVSMLKCSQEFLMKAESASEDTVRDSIRPTFLRYFERKADWLIIFDNADYLDKDASETNDMENVLKSYIPVGLGHILVTTRCDRDFMGAARIPVGVFPSELASRLLVEVSGFEANSDVDKLSEKLGYLPLALQYAAAYIREYCSSYREYLDLWEEKGMPLFDQDDGDLAEQTVRKAFHITLDKLKDDIVAVDFLHRLASLNVNALPLKYYLEAVEERPEKTYYDRVYYEPFYDCEMVRMLDEQYKIRQYRIEEKMGNGYMRLRNIPFPRDPVQESVSETIDARVIDADYLHPALKDTISRNKLIQKLKSCSLIKWDKTNVYTHPLLREIIFDEMTVQEKFKWYSGFFTQLLLTSVYHRAGNKEAAKELLFRSICAKLGLKKVDYNQKSESQIHVGSDYFERAECHFECGPELDSFLLDVLSLNDADFTIKFFKLRHELEKQGYISRFLGYSSHDIVCEQLAVMLNCDIAYRSYQAPKQCTKGDKKYFVGFAHRSKCTGVMETPVEETVCEAARAAIDIWLTDIEDDGERRQKLQGLVADEDADWWIIALPLGDAYFFEKNDL